MLISGCMKNILRLKSFKYIFKALQIADESGLKLGRLINVSESGGYVPVPMYDRAYAMEAKTAGSVAPEIQAGEQEITVTVTLVYDIE